MNFKARLYFIIQGFSKLLFKYYPNVVFYQNGMSSSNWEIISSCLSILRSNIKIFENSNNRVYHTEKESIDSRLKVLGHFPFLIFSIYPIYRINLSFYFIQMYFTTQLLIILSHNVL